MSGIAAIGSDKPPIPMLRGMRVVVLDDNGETSASICNIIDHDSNFVLAGESGQWPECEVLLDRFVPELLIARLVHIPPEFLNTLSASAFPVVVGVSDRESEADYRREVYDVLIAPVLPEQIRSLLARAQFEIYRRKADELSSLLRRYMACAGDAAKYLAQFNIEDDNQVRKVPLDQVLYIAADGNYLHVHTSDREYEIRETLVGVSARLDPTKFARVHRSFIVNLAHVVNVLAKESSASMVTLSNGMEVPVGPNYRAEVDAIVSMRNRMTA